MAFHYPDKAAARAALYDAALLLLEADLQLACLDFATVDCLSKLCSRINQGQEICPSPVGWPEQCPSREDHTGSSDPYNSPALAGWGSID